MHKSTSDMINNEVKPNYPLISRVSKTKWKSRTWVMS